MYVSGRTPPRTLTIPNAQIREIAKSVLRDARVKRAMEDLGISRERVEKVALSKLTKRDASARVRELERKLSQANPVEAVAIRRDLAFARLEGGAK